MSIPDLSGLRISTQLEHEAEEILRKEGIGSAVPMMDPKTMQSQKGNVPLMTNVYGIVCQQQMQIFQYDVQISSILTLKDGSELKRELTKKDKNDAVLADRRDRCRDVFSHIRQTEQRLFENCGCVYYDLQSIMYSLGQLDVPPGKEGGRVFTITGQQLSRDEKSSKKWGHFSKIEFVIRRVSEDNSLSLGDFGSLTSDLSQSDRSLAQFLDIATSQSSFIDKTKHLTFNAGTSFLLQPSKHGFQPHDEARFDDNGAYLGIGAKKGVHYMEGPESVRGKNVAIVVETKKTPFHLTETVYQKASRFVRDLDNVDDISRGKLNKVLSNLQVETRHLGHPQRFLIKGVETENSDQKRFDRNGQTVSVLQYLQETYGINLKHPRAPVLKARGKDGKFSYYPMEICWVVESQRVKTNQQTPRQVQDMIKKCAVPPSTLITQNKITFNSLSMTAGPWLDKASVKVIEHPLVMNGKSLPPPDFQFGRNNQARVNPNNFTWQGREYLIPAGCKSWAAFAFMGPRERLNNNDLGTFVSRFAAEARSHGMQMPDCVHHEILSSGHAAIRDKIAKAKQNRCDFVLVVHPDNADEIHGAIKLNELEFSIVTQAVRLSTVMNVVTRGQRQTLENIVNKTNIKMGGLNYTLSLSTPQSREVLGTNTLYIGFGVNHPGGGLGENPTSSSASQGKERSSTDASKPAPPTIVGYAANYGLEHEFEFIGDFFCQQPLRDEKIEIIRQIIARCLEKYRANRKTEPKRIIIYRNGASEGQFASILKYEVPLIKLALQKSRCNASLNVIVSNKLQGIRFFAKDIDSRAKPADQNIKPGTVVDHTVTHPVYNEFFLNAHRALQGTARTPKYTVLVNESNLTLDQFEGITYHLCYGHQIVYMPTSLPSPVFIANRYAERGRKVFLRWIEREDIKKQKIESYQQMSEMLQYYNNAELCNRRINA